MFQFYKGRTNNHLTWVMVDATDYASPESALSAATKIKIFGKLRGAAGVNFVSSGTGSLTNDIVHVGPSVLGIYSIGLAKADLSDASAAWYDQYIISLSATGAAYQTLIADGGIDQSAISGYQSRLSDLFSQVSDFRSDVNSLLTTTGVALNASALSDIRSAIAAITVTLSASDISDIASAVAAGVTTVTVSNISDIASAVWANTIGARVDSRILVNQSYLSDIRSNVVLNQSLISDIQSKLSDVESNLLSFLTTTGVALNASALSDVRSAITAVTATLSASDLSDIRSAIAAAQSDLRSLMSTTGPTLSDIASAVWIDPIALLLASRVSDVQSKLSDVESNLLSVLGTTGVQLNASSLSDLRSAITAGATGLDASALSDIASAVVAAIAAQGVSLDASSMSDIRSAITVGGGLAASAISDIESALASRLSDILSAAVQTNSRVLLNQSRISDVYSMLSDLQSDFQSRVPKLVANNSQVSGVLSDIQSAMAALPTAAAIADAVFDEAITGHTVSGSYGDKLGAHLPAVLKGLTTAGGTTTAIALNTTTGIDGAAPSSSDDFYNGRVAIFTSGALAGQATAITDYVGATKVLTVVALTAAPASGVTLVIV
jgi:hypothetical protein